MLKTEGNSGGLPLDVFDGIRKGTYDNRAQFFRDLTLPFSGHNRSGAQVSEGVLESRFDGIRRFSEVNHTEDLRRTDVPTTTVHGDEDRIVPIGASAMVGSRIVRGAIRKVYRGGDNGWSATQQAAFNVDPAFARDEPVSGATEHRSEEHA
jgi:non-heme chloroperoxidase